ncbi:Na+/H+ antiporter [Natrinema pellirubrum DSM 15624]|uniref:Na+/H+ antiporter n=1 Tax=Natrinema pellirubrum (strain DSM 15624 / CIP 106293 / JCM 10476 / NCIMB 786 / 157) TaxID=797303 RepID=L0JJD6_NATP1|nr:Na+/H+ antiporter NhaC family protein [Natrinema pellirubrum]AGB31650.1 Na+/H+ antiporter [Natrinema pellirubrum DSM 15624]
MGEFGILSLVPPILAITLAITTRRIILSLFVSIWFGAVIYTGGLGIGQTFDWVVAAIIADDGFHAEILIFTLLLGSGVALIWRLGGAIAIQEIASKRLETRRKVGIVAWLLGMALFFDDYANTAIIGNTMRETSDRVNISREKLSYIVDSTAAPVATIGISGWVAFQLSMINEAFSNIETGAGVQTPDVFTVYLQSIPYNAYAILAIVMVGVIVVTQRDYGEMLTAERRAWETGKVNDDDADPLQEVEGHLSDPITDRPMLRTFLLPIVVLIAVTIGSALRTGYDGQPVIESLLAGEFATFVETATTIAGNGSWTTALVWGSFAMVSTAFGIGIVYGLFTADEGIDAILEGFELMLTAVTILILAWSISTVADALGTGAYVATLVEGTIPVALFPVAVFITATFISLTMGSSWATMSLLTPVAISVAFDLTGGFGLAPVTVGAVFSGAIFGDHTSPISDTTVLSSTFTGADLVDHVRTQAYYATTVATVVVVCYLLYGFFAVPPLVFLPIGVVLLVGLVYGLSEFDANRRGIDVGTVRRDVDPTGQDADSEHGTAPEGTD